MLEFLAWLRVGKVPLIAIRNMEMSKGNEVFLGVRFDYLYDDICGKMPSVGQ